MILSTTSTSRSRIPLMSIHSSIVLNHSIIIGLLLLFIGTTIHYTNADIIFENEVIVPEEIFDLEYAIDSTSTASTSNQTKYYCIFRSNWNKINHPEEFPSFARYGAPILFSHTKQFVPYLKNREAPQGVEKLVESGFTDTFQAEIKTNGNVIGDYAEATAFDLDQNDWDKNYKYLPPVNVSYEHNYLSGIAEISPSPDWFTGFYLFDTLKTTGQTFWENFKLRTYPWDAGSDSGEHYTDTPVDTDPPENVVRFTVDTVPNKIFLNEAGDEILYVAEWECILHTCPSDNPGCEKENWPPANGCDVLKYPECDKPCDPADTTQDSVCTECSDGSFYADCCLAGANQCEETDGSSDSSSSTTTSKNTTVFLSLLLMTAVIDMLYG